jgi:hypothetical protein
MELLNMFSDLAPISNNGYRQQLHTDPGILQGQEFLRNEHKIKKIVERNLDLNLVSDVNGSESTIIHSVENFDPSQDANDDYNNNKNKMYDNLYDNLYDNYKEGLTTNNTPEEIAKKRNEYASIARSFATCEMGEFFCDKKGRCVKSSEVSTDKCEVVKKEGFESSIQEGFIEALTTDEKYNNLRQQYNTALEAYTKLIEENTKAQDQGGGLASSVTNMEANQQRTKFFNQAKELSIQLNNIASSLVNSVKTDTKTDFDSYNKMQTEIDKVQMRIKEIYLKMQANKDKNPADIETSMAKESESDLLTKQRYYMYIIWFIIMVVVLYITITNIVNAESSFTVLLICVIVLVCLFLFFIYNKWNGEWYDFKYKLKNFNLGIPDIPKLDFNPLVRIRYTS